MKRKTTKTGQPRPKPGNEAGAENCPDLYLNTGSGAAVTVSTEKPKKVHKTEIFKLQRPLYSTGPTYGVLAYNKSQRKQYTMDMNKDLKKLFDGEFKVFVHAHEDENTGQFLIDGAAPWQDW